MTLNAYIVFAIVLFLAIQYNKLIDRERMYEQYFNFAVDWMFMNKFDPVEVHDRLRFNHKLRTKDKDNYNDVIAKEAVEDAFVHCYRLLGVKIENLKIYWNE